MPPITGRSYSFQLADIDFGVSRNRFNQLLRAVYDGIPPDDFLSEESWDDQFDQDYPVSGRFISLLRLRLRADTSWLGAARNLAQHFLDTFDRHIESESNYLPRSGDLHLAKMATHLAFTNVSNYFDSQNIYTDAWGRLFELSLESIANEKRKLVITQHLAYPRSPEWLYTEDLRPLAAELFKENPDIAYIELQYQSSEPITGYIPTPPIIERENADSLSALTHLQIVNAVASVFGLRQVDGSHDGETSEIKVDTPVFSQRDGRKRLIGYFKPLSVPVGSLDTGVAIKEVKPEPAKVAIMVTTETHALEDLLKNFAAGFMNGMVSIVVGNHDTKAIRQMCKKYGVPFKHIPTKGNPQHKAQVLEFLKTESIRPDLIVMAKYMQILEPEFIREFGADHIINVHHGLLPSFQGAKPYEQALDRGVEIFGATAHYATKDLDSGPLIAQEADRISSTTASLGERRKIKGRVSEARALTRAVQAWLRGRLRLIYDRTEMRDDPHHKGAQIAKYLGLVIDPFRFMWDMSQRTNPGELHLRQMGDSFDLDGPIRADDLKKSYQDFIGANAGLPPELADVKRIRFTTCRDQEIVFEITDGHLIEVPVQLSVEDETPIVEDQSAAQSLLLGAQQMVTLGGVRLPLPLGRF